jgi:hypothetical protein
MTRHFPGHRADASDVARVRGFFFSSIRNLSAVSSVDLWLRHASLLNGVNRDKPHGHADQRRVRESCPNPYQSALLPLALLCLAAVASPNAHANRLLRSSSVLPASRQTLSLHVLHERVRPTPPPSAAPTLLQFRLLRFPLAASALPPRPHLPPTMIRRPRSCPRYSITTTVTTRTTTSSSTPHLISLTRRIAANLVAVLSRLRRSRRYVANVFFERSYLMYIYRSMSSLPPAMIISGGS